MALAERQYGLFSDEQALARGFTRRGLNRLIAAGSVRRLYPGVLCSAGTPTSWELRLRAAVMAAGNEAAASHRSAGRFLGIGGCPDDVVEITSPRHLRWDGVTVHRRPPLPRADLITVAGLRLTSATRTLIDLGSMLEEEQLEAALDGALLEGLTSVAYLEKRLATLSQRGRNGTAAIKSLLGARRPDQAPTESELERAFVRKVIRPHRLREPAFQFPAAIDERNLRIDFAYPDLMLAVEVLGWRFHLGRRRWERDLARHNALANAGWTVLYFAWNDIFERPGWVAEKIRIAIESRSTLF